jgi:hypothetical protein
VEVGFAGGSGLLVWLPQLAYWKMNTGHWFFYSYIGEPFFLVARRF